MEPCSLHVFGGADSYHALASAAPLEAWCLLQFCMHPAAADSPHALRPYAAAVLNGKIEDWTPPEPASGYYSWLARLATRSNYRLAARVLAWVLVGLFGVQSDLTLAKLCMRCCCPPKRRRHEETNKWPAYPAAAAAAAGAATVMIASTLQMLASAAACPLLAILS